MYKAYFNKNSFLYFKGDYQWRVKGKPFSFLPTIFKSKTYFNSTYMPEKRLLILPLFR